MSRHLLKSLFADPKVKAALRMVIGWVFIVLGFIGLFLPLLQGILFIAVGIALLAHHSPFFAKIRNAIYQRFPKLQQVVRHARARIRLAHRHAIRRHHTEES